MVESVVGSAELLLSPPSSGCAPVPSGRRCRGKRPSQPAKRSLEVQRSAGKDGLHRRRRQQTSRWSRQALLHRSCNQLGCPPLQARAPGTLSLRAPHEDEALLGVLISGVHTPPPARPALPGFQHDEVQAEGDAGSPELLPGAADKVAPGPGPLPRRPAAAILEFSDFHNFQILPRPNLGKRRTCQHITKVPPTGGGA